MGFLLNKGADNMDLFSYSGEKQQKKAAPLAWRMRPKNLDNYFGQEHILAKGKLLRRLIDADKIQSVLFFGNPGIGKTSLASVIAESTNANFITLNAVTSNVKELREVIKNAKDNIALYNKKTILFIDEIHRFNKAQQDALLPDVEKGTIGLIGATTQNPFFSVIPALVSRSQIFELKSLTKQNIIDILKHAIKNDENLKLYQPIIENEVFEYFADYSNGDARRALSALELAIITTENVNGKKIVTLKTAENSIDKKPIVYDKNEHYDVISAFQKSMRGSDPDATVYWMAKMIYAGEDPLFIARRIMVCASEDVGMADPNALTVATAAFNASQHIGLPEARIPLAQAAIYVACAPKSNAVITAIDSALRHIEENPELSVPTHLRDAHYQGVKRLGHGKDYIYPHSNPEEAKKQNYLPVDGLRFYNSHLDTKTCK